MLLLRCRDDTKFKANEFDKNTKRNFAKALWSSLVLINFVSNIFQGEKYNYNAFQVPR